MVGAVAGSPGTLPTNWNVTSGAGLTQTVVGLGSESGIQYIDLRFNGTANASSLRFVTDTTSGVAAAPGQIWSNSVYAKLTAGTMPFITLRNVYRTSGGAAISTPNQQFNLTSSLTRSAFTDAAAPATTAFLQQEVLFTLTIGLTYDFTIRIAAPQMELGDYATTFIPTTTAAVTRIADAASKTGVSSLIGQNSGTLFVEWDNSNKSLVNLIETYNNASGLTGTSSIILQKSNNSQFNIRVFDSLNNYSVIFSATIPSGTNKVALAYQPGLATLYLNGSLVGSNTRTYVFVSTRDAMAFDNRAPYPRAQAAIFPTRLTNAQLAEITTL
jgi:hypothetical protein